MPRFSTVFLVGFLKHFFVSNEFCFAGRVIPLTTYQKPLFCRFTRNSSCPGISPQRCFAHIIAKSYHFRTVIQLSRCTRENIPQGVTFKTPIFVGFFKTFLFSLKLHNKKSRHIDSTNSGRTFHPLAQFVLKLCNGLNFKL